MYNNKCDNCDCKLGYGYDLIDTTLCVFKGFINVTVCSGTSALINNCLYMTIDINGLKKCTSCSVEYVVNRDTCIP